MRGFRLLPQPPYGTLRTTYLGFAFVPQTNDYFVGRLATVAKVIGDLNTIKESFKQISLSASICKECCPYLCLLNDSLALVALVSDTCFDAWLMDKNRVEECWTKKYSYGRPPLLGCDIVFGFRPNNEILVFGGNDC
ncbi:hypothetical protein RHMOL_Rhmol05G0127300 [Rhododendron molle]|uniref:Uncharacterized protein n=1 Tax=Rhododendron molle TaxID=49168 RepID=A0ACC0NQL0_RHOML|nr:hypothetical protein RHMOL_Rhmol05G0127300 [Rhododendron molle]